MTTSLVTIVSGTAQRDTSLDRVQNGHLRFGDIDVDLQPGTVPSEREGEERAALRLTSDEIASLRLCGRIEDEREPRRRRTGAFSQRGREQFIELGNPQRLLGSRQRACVRDQRFGHAAKVSDVCEDGGVKTDRATLTYRIVMAIAWPIVRLWGRLQVVGAELLPTSGPILLIANHDSQWDPVIIGVAANHRRQVRALAKSSLWKNPVVARVLDGMGQIPIERGRGDTKALSAAIDRLSAGACIGVFPEGTVSRGKPLRALSGAGRLAVTAPDARLVCVRVTGAVDIARFPKRPRIRVEFFEPTDGQPRPDESAMGLSKRWMAEIRAGAPPVACGRRLT